MALSKNGRGILSLILFICFTAVYGAVADLIILLIEMSLGGFAAAHPPKAWLTP